MSAWRGLANPERHAPTSVTDMAWCNVCDGPCYSPEACCCCLAAEVEALRARNEQLVEMVQRQEWTFERQEAEHAELEALRASVQRVERLLDRCDQDTYDFYGGEGSPVVLTQYVRDALDGGESDE